MRYVDAKTHMFQLLDGVNKFVFRLCEIRVFSVGILELLNQFVVFCTLSLVRLEIMPTAFFAAVGLDPQLAQLSLQFLLFASPTTKDVTGARHDRRRQIVMSSGVSNRDPSSHRIVTDSQLTLEAQPRFARELV